MQGNGYSSLAYLKQFDIDYLKIDKLFIIKLLPNSQDKVLCEAMIAKAHTLDIKVSAEDVETTLQQDLLKNMTCDLGNMRSSPKRLWRIGFFVIKAMLTGGLVARRKALTKSTEYPVRPAGWITKGPSPLSKYL
jgi:hypothetical protein